MPAPIILHVEAKNGLAKAALGQKIWKGCDETFRLVREKVRKRAERKSPERLAVNQLVQLVPFNRNAKFQRVEPSDEKCIIIALKRIPSVEEGAPAQTSRECRNPLHGELGRVMPGNRPQRRIAGQRVDRLRAGGVIHKVSIKPEAERIAQRGTKDVVLLEDKELALR